MHKTIRPDYPHLLLMEMRTGTGGKYRYECLDVECDTWTNFFGYDENNKWRFKFAIDFVLQDEITMHIRTGTNRQGFPKKPGAPYSKDWSLPAVLWREVYPLTCAKCQGRRPLIKSRRDARQGI